MKRIQNILLVLILLLTTKLNAQVLTETNTGTWSIYPRMLGAPPVGWNTSTTLPASWIGAGIDPCTWAPSVSSTSQRLLGSTFVTVGFQTAYFRTTFTLTNVSDITSLVLNYNVDDNATFWLNGTIIAGGGAGGGTIFSRNIPISTLRCGVNVLAVQANNTNTDPSRPGCFFIQANLVATKRTENNNTTHYLNLGCDNPCDTVRLRNYTYFSKDSNILWNDGSRDSIKIFCNPGTYIATTTINGCVDRDTFIGQVNLCCDTCTWKLNGNYGVRPYHFIGSKNVADVVFKTSNSERMRIKASGPVGIGTNNPAWNCMVTIDNRNYKTEKNDFRNALHLISMQSNCSHGYGEVINTNLLGGTKALAIQGDGLNNALIWGNGMSFFQNRMQIGGASPTHQICDANSTGHMLVINGTGLVNSSINILSDRRFKQNIKSIENANDIIRKLNPVTYDFDTNKFPERNFETKNSYGFIAQELKEVLPNIVNTEHDDYLSVNYIALIPVLTKAIKEQQAQIEELKKLVSQNGSKTSASTGIGEANKSYDGGYLAQNTPNPFSNNTEIKYQLPKGTQTAMLGIYDLNGSQVKMYPINAQNNSGSVYVQAQELKAGMYIYTLIIDGRAFDSKKMVLTAE